VGRDLAELRAELRAAGIDAALVAKTPEPATRERWREIQAWLDEHPEVTEFAIVDDLWDMGPLGARFVRTSPLHGLDAAAAEQLAALFELRDGGEALGGA
jgi:HAD domain in Swiss Army Knife RNA repair proteins